MICHLLGKEVDSQEAAWWPSAPLYDPPTTELLWRRRFLWLHPLTRKYKIQIEIQIQIQIKRQIRRQRQILTTAHPPLAPALSSASDAHHPCGTLNPWAAHFECCNMHDKLDLLNSQLFAPAPFTFWVKFIAATNDRIAFFSCVEHHSCDALYPKGKARLRWRFQDDWMVTVALPRPSLLMFR